MEISTITIISWEDLVAKQRPYMVYRGQSNADWDLSTSFERACMLNDGNLDFAKIREERLLLSFKRHYHEYSQNIPDIDDNLRWLALMQHHGAPTRLIDWTYSILVATYFAVENANTDSAVWEIDTKWLVDATKIYLQTKSIENKSLAVHLGRVSQKDAITHFKNFFLSNKWQFVRIMSPYYRDRRLTAQQGIFTCPGDVSVPFMKNLSNMAEDAKITKYIIPLKLRRQMLYQLYSANIGRFTLFPGLDGFASTLRIFHPLIWDMEFGPNGETAPIST